MNACEEIVRVIQLNANTEMTSGVSLRKTLHVSVT
jgi:hypothetical protein